MFFLDHIWIIPLLPMFGAVTMFFFGRKLSGIPPIKPAYVPHDGHGDAHDDPSSHSAVQADPHAAHGGHDAHAVHEKQEWVNVICVGVVVVAFLWSCLAVWQYTAFAAEHHGAPFEKILYTWLGTDDGHLNYANQQGGSSAFHADAGFLLDPLSSVWLLFVTGVGMLIHIYSTGYMAHDGGYYRFMGYMNLFMFSMLTLILANNYALMFVGWEGVGLCSYLLIGFYFHRQSASSAANKAFITNRVGDFGMLLGMFTIAW